MVAAVRRRQRAEPPLVRRFDLAPTRPPAALRHGVRSPLPPAHAPQPEPPQASYAVRLIDFLAFSPDIPAQRPFRAI